MEYERLDELFNLIKGTLDRVEKLETTFNDLLCTVDEARNEYEVGERRNGFRERNAEKLSQFADKLKAIEGDDFDIVDQAFADYDSLENKPEEEVYVAALCAKVSEQLNKIAEAYGINTNETPVEATLEDGETEIKAEGTMAEVIDDPEAAKEEAEESGEQAEEAEQQIEEAVEGEAEAEDEIEDEITEDDPAEIEADLKELEEELKKYR